MDNKIQKLKDIIKESERIVFFGGAGVSTESGIPDFRSKDGLYNQKYAYPPEEILSHTFFVRNVEEFYTFYKEKMNCLDYLPNVTHVCLAKLEEAGKVTAVVTQNIDGLHQKAGSKNVYELHGSVMRNYCTKCGASFSAEYVFASKGVPVCKCGGVVKPDVVLYGEMLEDSVVSSAVAKIAEADTLIVAGTSLTVYPASGLLRYFRGKNLVLINRDVTPYDNVANLVLHMPLGKVFTEIFSFCREDGIIAAEGE